MLSLANGQEKLLVKKCFVKKNILSKKILGQKKFWVKKNFGSKNILGKKVFGMKKILLKKIWIRNIICLEKTGRVNPRGRIYDPPPQKKIVGLKLC